MGTKSGNKKQALMRLDKHNNLNSSAGVVGNSGITRNGLTDQLPIPSPMGIGNDLVEIPRAIEPRILLDAAMVETAETAIIDAAADQAEQFFEDSSGGEPSDVFEHIAASSELLIPQSPQNNSSEIVFIDAAIDDINSLVDTLNPSAEVVVLSTDSDGVEQIADYLSDRHGIDAVHIISHGQAGTLQLGNAQLTAESINGAHSDEIAVISGALSSNADIILYGCNFADGTRGNDAVAALASASNADVAASTDLTGSAFLGGDWDLEVATGNIEAFAISPVNWAHTLDLTITNASTTGATGLAQSILGSGVTINSATYSGTGDQAGTFTTGPGASFGNNILTFTDGAIFSTGTASSVAGPNNASGFTVNAPAGIDNDTDFNSLAGGATFDASFIEINFTPDVPPGSSAGDTGRMTMEIVFGSDEYNEYVYGGVNDTLAVIVNGANQAVVPNGLAIGIDTINDAAGFNPSFGSVANDPNPEHTAASFESANPSLYTNNDNAAFNTQMDGFTITIPVTFDVIVGQSNTIKLGIADTADAAFDSWMFVKADSGQTVIVAENDTVTTPTDVPTTIDVTANDYDLQGDPLTVTHILGQPVNPGDVINLASGATVTVEANGDLTVAGDGTNTANDAFTYSITDGNGGTSTAFVNVAITAPNSAPVAVDDTISASEDTTTSATAATGLILPNDTDVDGHTLSIAQVNGVSANVGNQITLASGALLTVNADGSYDYDPNGAFETLAVGETGADSFTYTVDDGFGGTDTATVTINIAGENDAPLANPDTASTDQNTALSISAVNGLIATNDTDVDVNDTLIVSQVNGVQANVGSQITLASGALLTVNADGSYDYDPNGAFDSLAAGDTTTDTFTYQVSDGNGGTSSASVTVTINGLNDAPVINLDPTNNSGGANDGNYENTFIEGLGPVAIVDPAMTITDLDNGDSIAQIDIILTNGRAGDILNIGSMPAGITVTSSPVGSLAVDGTITLTVTGGPTNTYADYQTALQSITYAANGAFAENPNPADRTIEITVHDMAPLASTTVTSTMHITPVNDAPSLNLDVSGIGTGYSDTFTEGGSAVPIADSDSLISDFDDTNIESATITLTNGQIGDILNLGTLPAGISLVGVTPTELTAPGTITIQLTGSASLADYQTAIEGINFSNSSDNPDTTQRQIDVSVFDGDDNSNTAMAAIDVIAVNDPPVVDTPIANQSSNDGAMTISIPTTSNFSDPDDTVLIYALGPGAPNWLTINPNTGEITNSAPVPGDASQNTNIIAGTPGTYDITVIASDPSNLSASDTFQLTITNLPPTAVDDVSSGDEDNDQSGNVITDALTGDADTAPDSDPVLVSDVNGSAVTTGNPAVIALTYGSLTMAEDGSWTFEPNAAANQLSDTDPNAVETVTYTIDDGNGGTDTATLTINIAGVNDPVQVVDPNDPTTDPTDPSYDPTNPTVIADPDNLIPDVSASDGETPASIPAGDYFGDAEGDTLTYSATNLPSGLVINPTTGEITGTIDPDASQNGNTAPGVYDVVITATDPQNNTATTTITYTITNLPPVANDDPLSGSEDGLTTGDVFADNGSGPDADTPPDNDPLIVSEVAGLAANVGVAVPGSNGGMFTINNNGTYSFDPGTDFQDLGLGETRDTTITYQVSDGQGGFDSATVTMTVQGSNDAPVVIDPNSPFPNPNDPPAPTDPNNVIPDVAGSDSVAIQPLDVSPYFYDVEGDTIGYSLDVGTTPSWLSIDPVSGIMTGTPPSNASQGGPNNDGIYTITIIAEDNDGAQVTTTVDFTIVNIPPTTTGIDDQTETAGYDFELPVSGSFDDPDGDVLQYSATGLPLGLSIDPVSGLISGTVNPFGVSAAPNGDGIYTVEVFADDQQGGVISTTFILTVTDPVVPDTETPPSPLPPSDPNGPPEAIIQPDLIIDGAVNNISSLGGNTGLFDINHPVTEALYQISPLSEGISINANGHPVTEMIDWIENTRENLKKTSELAPSFLENISYFYGGDQKITADNQVIIARTLGWENIIFLEIIGGEESTKWEIESLNGQGISPWAQIYGSNLIAIQKPTEIDSAEIILRGSDEAGQEILLDLDINLIGGEIEDIKHIYPEQVQGFSGQLHNLVNQSKIEAQSMLHTSS